jgi:hypothetical protein
MLGWSFNPRGHSGGCIASIEQEAFLHLMLALWTSLLALAHAPGFLEDIHSQRHPLVAPGRQTVHSAVSHRI